MTDVESDRRKAFANFEGSASGAAFYDKVKQRALKGLRDSPIRSIYWKTCLQVLSRDGTDTWMADIKKARAEYTALREKFTINPSTEKEDMDLRFNNPLSTAKDSPWSQYFQDNQLSSTIKLDVTRTYPEQEFFQREDTQAMMLNVLFVWGKLNPKIGYRQGMNELLAPILVLMSREARARQSTDGEDDLMSNLLDKQYIEHDVFCCFQKVMIVMAPYFEPKAENKDKKPASPPAGSSPFAAQADEKAAETAIVAKCNHIHHTLLAQADPTVYAHLEKLQILPTLYALRWMRVLFSREFHIEDVMTFWDAIFAYNDAKAPLTAGKSFPLADHICIAMIYYIRTQLLESDYSFCMKRLLKYPPVEDVRVLVERAIQLIDPAKRPAVVAAQAAARKAANPASDGEAFRALMQSASPKEKDSEDDKNNLFRNSDSNLFGGGSKSKGGDSTGNSKLDALVDGFAKLNPFKQQGNAGKAPQQQQQAQQRPPQPGQQPRPPQVGPGAGPQRPNPQQQQQSEVNKLRTEIAQVTTLMGEMGKVLEAIVDRMHAHYVESEKKGEPFSKDQAMLSIAELKHVKDVLIGRLTPDEILGHISALKRGGAHPLRPTSPTGANANANGTDAAAASPGSPTDAEKSDGAPPSSSPPPEPSSPTADASSTASLSKTYTEPVFAPLVAAPPKPAPVASAAAPAAGAQADKPKSARPFDDPLSVFKL